MSKDIEYRSFTLGDIGVIELLIAYRHKYDDYLLMKQDSAQSFDAADIIPFYEEVLMTYASLDVYIKECGFSEIQLNLIDLLGRDIAHEDISMRLGIQLSTIEGRLNTICKRIKKENDWQWRRYTYIHKLGLRTKACSKCKVELPGTAEFYGNDARNTNGFQGRCRKCKT